MNNNIFKIVIAGSRKFNDYDFLKKKVNKFLENKKDSHKIIIISGHAKGTDELGERYAKEKGYNTKIYPAEWKKYGRAAGPIRNKIMINKANALIAFWDGKSRGTSSSINLAKEEKQNV